MKKLTINRILAVILSVSMLATSLAGCSGKKEEQASNIETSSVSIETSAIVDTVIETLVQKETETLKAEDIEETAAEVFLYSSDYQDYIGDMETFVYGLLANQLKERYDVFPSYVTLESGDAVYGLSYTDYSECLADENSDYFSFTSGMIPYYGELEIPDSEFDNGLIVKSLDYENENTDFLLTYQSDAFADHCVVYGQYLRYGVGEDGRVFYNYEPFNKETCDTSLGSLYSYDEGKFLYDDGFGEYIPITGESLSDAIDYDELEAEVNRILSEQDENFASVDIESCAYFAQEAVASYLLSLQSESFLGYDVKELAKMAQELDPVECLRLTKDGVSTVDLRDLPNDAPQEIAKWLVGAGCVVVCAVSLVGSVVTVECPPLSAAMGAAMGASIEVFMEVVIANERLEDVDLRRVALAAAAGGVSGFLGPYINATTAGATHFFVDSSLDGLIGGIEQTVGAYLDGADGVQMAKSFGYGFAMGFGLSAAFKGVGALASAAGKGAQKTAQKVFPKLTNKVSEALKNVPGTGIVKKIGEKIVDLKTTVDATPFHSKYISKKLAQKQLLRIISQGDDELKKKAFDALKKQDIIDSNGEIIPKDKLKELFDNADNDTVIAYFKIDDEVVNITKQNGVVGIVFDNNKFQTVELDDFLTPDRAENFKAAAKKYLEKWSQEPSTIPAEIQEVFAQNNTSLEQILNSGNPENKLVDLVQKSSMVFHENIDMKTVTLVTRQLHDKTKETGIAHFGGRALADYLKGHMGQEFLDRFIDAAANGAVISLR